MKNCIFEPNDKGTFTCPNCDTTVPIPGVNSNCMKSDNTPSVLNRAVNFTTAATKHALAGNPVVTESQMKERLSICQSCPLFKLNQNAVGGVCTHASCGCNIQDNLNYLNKIAWADQECPIGKWGKVGV